MITDELISEFSTHICKKRFVPNQKVIAHKVYDTFIHIMYDLGGESVKIEEYYEWIRNKRLLELGI